MSHLCDLMAIYFLCTRVLAHCGILYGVWAVGRYDICRNTTLHSRNILVSHSLWKCMRIILVTASHNNLDHQSILAAASVRSESNWSTILQREGVERAIPPRQENREVLRREEDAPDDEDEFPPSRRTRRDPG